jgi:DNA-directed RNA polymerase subunit RPC12/RpoP
MYADRATVLTCEDCGDTGLDVQETHIHGETRNLCPGCSWRVGVRERGDQA